MELGGAESALLGLLQSIDSTKAQVDLFIYAHHGELMEYIPTDKINLLPEVEAYALTEEPIVELIKRGYWRLALSRLIGRWEYSQYQKNNIPPKEDVSAMTFQQNRTVNVLPYINPSKEYDLAISFLSPHYICAKRVNAKRKIAWIHTDYTNVFIHREMELKMWNAYDLIGSISPEVTTKFTEVFPSLKHKIVEIENILSSTFIRKRAESPCPILESDKSMKILTIGRYSYAKKMEDIPYLCRGLIEKGLKVHWYIIGYGSSDYEKLVRDNIEKAGMENNVILLGKQSNPYPFIKACDIYAQPSRYEGKSITVREAQILCKLVMVTNYPTAVSQIKDGLDGVIVPLEQEDCINAMNSFLQNFSLQKQIVEYLKTHDYGNQKEIEKIYEIANDIYPNI